jgi:CheY-like chemotaxis protein
MKPLHFLCGKSDGVRVAIDFARGDGVAIFPLVRAPFSSRPSSNEASVRVVVIADDDPDQREALREFFADAGFAVEVYEDGVQLLDALKRRFDDLGSPPELIVTDVQMPGIDGLRAISRLRDFDRYTQVVIITGHPNLEARAMAAILHAELLEKPLKPEQLRQLALGR